MDSLSFFLNFISSQLTKLPIVATPEVVADGTYIVTGANTGLGYECAKHLVNLGAGRVIVAVRSLQKGHDAIAKIRSETGRADAGEAWELDLTSFDSVEAFARKLDTLDRLDALVENAAVLLPTFSLAEGLETTLAVNVVSTMLLAVRALPKLHETAQKFGRSPRLAVVGSELGFTNARYVENTESNVFYTLSQKEKAEMSRRYAVSKQLLAFAVRELASLQPLADTGVAIFIVTPGMCYSDLGRHHSFLGALPIMIMKKLLARTTEEGSRTLLHAAVAGPDSHGKFLADCEVKDSWVPNWIQDENSSQTQKRVWADLVDTLKRNGHDVDPLSPSRRSK